jgi:hypothetical protein
MAQVIMHNAGTHYATPSTFKVHGVAYPFPLDSGWANAP